jgi:exodeoxyribonuclease-3
MSGDSMKKIITWNIEGLYTRRELFLEMANESQADIICLQEPKKDNAWLRRFRADYYSVFPSQAENPSHHGGSVIYFREQPIAMKNQIKNELFKFMECEGRFGILEYPSFFLINIYLPNAGNERENFENKALSFEWLNTLCSLADKQKPVIACGDFNVARYYRDEVKRREHRGTAGFDSNEILMLERFKALGFVDAVMHMYPDEKSICDYLISKSINDNITRFYTVDYIMVSERIADKIQSVDILIDYERHKSKHLPIEMVIDI